MRILVVDDDFVSRMKIKALLSGYGNCDMAPNGELAIRIFKKAHREKNPYRLITMDINMPGMTGQQVVHKIREWEESQGIKNNQLANILMITIHNSIENITTSFEEGCEWFLVKPVTPENLREAMTKMGFARIQYEPMKTYV